jgi:hypothetical protein
VNAELIVLSHRNTNVRSLRATLGQKRTLLRHQDFIKIGLPHALAL